MMLFSPAPRADIASRLMLPRYAAPRTRPLMAMMLCLCTPPSEFLFFADCRRRAPQLQRRSLCRPPVDTPHIALCFAAVHSSFSAMSRHYGGFHAFSLRAFI